jgi:hypothetical protein
MMRSYFHLAGLNIQERMLGSEGGPKARHRVE